MPDKNSSTKQSSTATNKTSYLLPGCLLATIMLYLPSLSNYLVGDSWTFMMKRSFFDNFSYFFKTMLPPETNALWLRPIPMFFYWLDTILWPGSNWGPHLVNIAFHAFNVWLIWKLIRLVRSHGASESPSPGLPEFAACMIYGLHPLNVGSVAWVAARFDLMSVTFGLAALYHWFRWLNIEQGRSRIVIAITFLMLAIFSKEQGVIYAAVCIASAAWMMRHNSSRKRLLSGIVAISLSLGAYIVFRLIVFQGLGGYMEARHGLSVLPPFYYLAAILYPFPNVLQNPTFSLTVAATALLVIGTLAVVLKSDSTKKAAPVQSVYIISAILLCLFGLLTNMPNPGLTVDRIMGHAESRFAINAIAGLSLAIAYLLSALSNKKAISHVIAIFIALLALAFTWRSDVQIQAWRDAGTVARLIVEDTVSIAPNPQAGSKLIFVDIPRNNDQWAYIFGIGLREALYLEYGRDDFDIIRYPKRKDLSSANPARDFVIRYDTATGRLESLQARRAE